MTRAKKQTGNKVANKQASTAKMKATRSRATSRGAKKETKANSSVTTHSAKTKQALVWEMLGQADGASMNELIDATGWLPHTVRAALSGLRKKGHQIHCRPGEGRISIYQLVPRRAGD